VNRSQSRATALSWSLVLAAAFVCGGCSRDPVVTIANRSDVALTNIVVSGSGFSERIESVASGAAGRVSVHPLGESGLRVAFDAGDRHVDVDDLAYIERGDRVVVTVRADLKVSARPEKSRFGSY
jgi:hypothetical protein